MKILVVGASGFIGSRLAALLRAAGHDVVCAVRRPIPSQRCISADFARDHRIEDWLPRLDGIDVVVNAVGILRETRTQTFGALHVRGPLALFAACAEARIRKVVQVSALGADEGARSRYHLSKRRAEEFLAELPLRWVIVQPSLVYGPGGASARLFTTLAALPVIPLPGRGEQRVQPIHVDDLVDAMHRIIEGEAFDQRRIAAVGERAVTLRELLGALRAQMGFAPPRFLPVPMPLVQWSARICGKLPGVLLDDETLQMLSRGNEASVDTIAAALGRTPRGVERFIAPHEATAAADAARLNWLLPVLRASVALVWIVTGIVSLGVYPVPESYALLARVGVPGALAPLMLYGAAALDLAFGIGVYAMRRHRRWLWRAQIALIVIYSAIIAAQLPEFWLHPFGPLLKNVPLLAAILMLHEFEGRR